MTDKSTILNSLPALGSRPNKSFIKEEKPRKVKGLRPRSEKRLKQETEYAKVKKLFLLANPKCQFEGCTAKSKDVHHMAGRIGNLLTDVSKFKALCRKHHDFVELNPTWAKANGYSLDRYNKN